MAHELNGSPPRGACAPSTGPRESTHTCPLIDRAEARRAAERGIRSAAVCTGRGCPQPCAQTQTTRDGGGEGRHQNRGAGGTRGQRRHRTLGHLRDQAVARGQERRLLEGLWRRARLRTDGYSRRDLDGMRPAATPAPAVCPALNGRRHPHRPGRKRLTRPFRFIYYRLCKDGDAVHSAYAGLPRVHGRSD
jgi:hypothetical protein